MARAPAPRAIRLGGRHIVPGQAACVRIRLSGTATDASAVPAWAAVGETAGPRVAVIAALRGHETAAARAAEALAATCDPHRLAGSLVVVPVFRLGGRFAPALRPSPAWRLPGDAGGDRRRRNAFTMYSEVVVGASAVIVLREPAAGRRGLPLVRTNLNEPRARRAALASGAAVALPLPAPAGSVAAAAAQAGALAFEAQAGPSGDFDDAAPAILYLVEGLLRALGLREERGGDGREPAGSDRDGPARPLRRPTPPLQPALIRRTVSVRAAAGGFLVDAAAAPGTAVRRGAVLARIAGPAQGELTPALAPLSGIVLEAPARAVARRGAPLFVLAQLQPGAQRPPFSPKPRRKTLDGKQRVGWAERIALPDLGVARLKAKIDTGARTSALHVAGLKIVGTSRGSGRRPVLEFTIPRAYGRRAAHTAVQAVAREYVVVRESSGHSERRPVIETSLQLGAITRRIRLTLTDRADMLFPMLIGRTALGNDFSIDPARRYLT